MPAKVIVRDLRKHYGSVEAASGVSFEIQDGEIFGLLGPNGAGKTTTVECILGLRDPDSGSIEMFGMDARQRPAEVKQKIGASLQTTSLQDKITPREALTVFGSFYRNRRDPQQLLERFSLTDKADAPFDTLSGGQRQRLALALAFVNQPELIFLDEPTTGLDPEARRDVQAEIAQMKREGYTVLLTTHNIEEAERLCDRIAIMNQGRVVSEGAARELIDKSTMAPTVFLATTQPLDTGLLAALPGVKDIVSENSGIRFSTVEVTRTLAELMKLLDREGNGIAELRVQKATLEDVLIELTGQGEMTGLSEQIKSSFRLYFRNRMGMFYNYLFPAIFLLAFRVLYRNEPVPLARHMGQLLTVTILGGACLGLPTTLVSERERGVWRRYRLTPVSTGNLLASTVFVRYFIVVTAGLLQLALAMAIGLPFPSRLLALCLAFTFVTFAFLSLGLIIATMADNVPSVQALGQCIFLPMLIIGGVAVPLSNLPDWAQHVSAFFPGRYAVDVLQACFTRQATANSRFDFAALLLIGIGGFAAGTAMFRWDAQQKFSGRSKAWLVAVIAAWGAVGGWAEFRGQVSSGERPPAPVARSIPAPANVPAPEQPTALPVASSGETQPSPEGARRSTRWQDVTLAEINFNVNFKTLPSDSGIVTPIARAGLDPPPDVEDQINTLKAALPDWQPGKVADPLQRVRNLMFVAAVPDVLRMEQFESYVPLIVFAELRKDIPQDDLVKLLYWVAVNPSGGDDSALNQLQPLLGIESPPTDMDAIRERVSIYSLKLVGRLTGKLR